MVAGWATRHLGGLPSAFAPRAHEGDSRVVHREDTFVREAALDVPADRHVGRGRCQSVLEPHGRRHVTARGEQADTCAGERLRLAPAVEPEPEARGVLGRQRRGAPGAMRAGSASAARLRSSASSNMSMSG